MKVLMATLISLAVVVMAFQGNSSTEEPPATPEFKLGFKELAEQIPEIVGTSLENEHQEPDGDTLQRTSEGLLVWSKADNLTRFTNGGRTWVNLPSGVRDRGNDERLPEEAQAESVPASAPGRNPAAAADLTPVPGLTAAPNTGRPATGTLFLDSRRGGSSRLVLENGRREDAVAVLATTTGTTVTSIYIRGGDSYTITPLADGDYDLYFTVGQDYDSASGRFASDVSYAKASRPLQFNSRLYQGRRVTLQPVVNGNLGVLGVDPAKFPATR